jgi:hypothetical protein
VGDVLNVAVELTSTRGKPRAMTLIHVGIPAGMRPQMAQLKQLREDGFVDFFEILEREVVLYFRHILPDERKLLNLHLMAEHAGTYTGVASRCYEYYGDSPPYWVKPLQVTIVPE